MTTLETDRLLLRPITADDAEDIVAHIGDYQIIERLAVVPYPYTHQHAQEFLSGAVERWQTGSELTFACIRKSDGQFMGLFSGRYEVEHRRMMFGYWLGRTFWNQGYITEAGRRIVDWSFERDPALVRIYAFHFGDNPASGRVMQKLGMTYEGTLRRHFLRMDDLKDCVYYGLLREEWQAQLG